MWWKKHSAGDREGWVLVAAWPWVNHFPSWVSVSSFVNRAAEFSQVRLLWDVDFDYWGIANTWRCLPGKPPLRSFFSAEKGWAWRKTEGGSRTGELSGSRPRASLRPYPAFLTCYSNQTNLPFKKPRSPSPHTHSTSKLKTFYRLVNLQLRWCSKEQLWSNFDNDENNSHMARFRALLLQLQCSWIDKSD